jgi:hypothetical protein
MIELPAKLSGSFGGTLFLFERMLTKHFIEKNKMSLLLQRKKVDSICCQPQKWLF